MVPGTTTGFNVNSLLVQGGGSICASLDVQGAPFLVLHGWICNWFQPFFPNNGMDPMDQLSSALGRDVNTMSDADLKSMISEVPVQATLYPVPATDILNIRLDVRLPMEMEVSVLDMSGRIVRGSKSYDLEAGTRDLTIDVTDLDNGNYFVRMVSNGEVITEQFVKVK
ncbi:MAG: T9SS type A sorting domain-containing protein [Flavobacteriales bacterium]